jgi:type I restriction enzyme M protein
MLDNITKKNIDDCRDVLVGKVPDPKSQIEQITLALIYKFMDDMDIEVVEKFQGKPKFFVTPEKTGNKDIDDKLLNFHQYAWRNLFNPLLSGNEVMELYGQALERLSLNSNIPELFRNIFKNAFLPYKDTNTLKLFLKYINQFEYSHSEKLGDAFEYLLSVMGSQGDAGQFRTPRHIIDFVTECVNPQKNESILDPSCGTAGFLLSAFKHILQENTDKRQGDKLKPDDRKKLANNLVGYDISPDMVRLSLANMYLHGFTTPQINEYDTLSSEERWNETFDVVLANPPFMTPKGGIVPHSKFGIKANRSEILFLDYIVDHLQGPCKAGIIIPEGVLHNDSVAYKTVRKKIIKQNYLLAVIELPHGVFKPYASVKTHVLIFDKVISKTKNNVLFLQVENDGFTQTDSRKPINGSQLPIALKIIEEFKQGDIQITKGIKYNFVSKTELLDDTRVSLIGRRYRAIRFAEKSKYPAIKLSRELIQVFKGLSPTQNTLEGDYPLIVTAKGNRTANYFSFDTKAICIPIVSSSGHGHASVHRIHYIDGKFALANIMCAIKVLDEDIINPQYLYYALLAMKDEVIASLMTGTSNVSLDMDDLYEIEIPLPNISVQNKFVAEQAKLENKILAMRIETKKLEETIVTRAALNWEASNIGLENIEVNIDRQNVCANEPFALEKPNNKDLELAMLVSFTKRNLGITYGDVGIQKTVFNLAAFYPKSVVTKYDFINSNFGTYSHQLTDDLKNNPLLIKKVIKGKEVYDIKSHAKTLVEECILRPEHEQYLNSMKRTLDIYKHSFINKETGKIELLNTVAKLMIDFQTIDFKIIYQGMLDWKIKQEKYLTKAEKFNENEVKAMIALMVKKDLVSNLINIL